MRASIAASFHASGNAGHGAITTLSAAGVRQPAGRAAAPPRPSACQIDSATNGMIGCTSRRIASSTPTSTRCASGRPCGVAQPALAHLHVPVAELRPGEVVNGADRLAEAVAFQVLRHRGRGRRQPAQNPAVLDRQLLRAAAAPACSLRGSAAGSGRRSTSCWRSCGRSRSAPTPASPSAVPGRPPATARRDGTASCSSGTSPCASACTCALASPARARRSAGRRWPPASGCPGSRWPGTPCWKRRASVP